MNVHAQVSMLFHLDKCIGCHTCSVTCKHMWTNRKGAEYMWWNNVETLPGTGYPTGWEDQEHYRGGWTLKKEQLKLRLQNRLTGLANLFYNPRFPELEDYYEPFTFRYHDLFTAPAGDDQPVAVPVSKITGKHIDIKGGPNWDDDLSGSSVYAQNDVDSENLTPLQKAQLSEVEGIVMQYLPRICNHCLNPSCVAACPSGSIYKREEDGVVLVNQDTCRAWRLCVSGCPYKKVYFNWNTGKSEKCILCYPRLETGQVPACAQTCVGRIRYVGVLLYDSDRIHEAAATADDMDLIQAQRDAILDPFDPEVISAALENGIERSMIESAQNSPIYKFVKVWKLGLPTHPEYRTLPMVFYVPPLSPVMSINKDGLFDLASTDNAEDATGLLSQLNNTRLPMQYLANLFSAGDVSVIRNILLKLMAVRIYKREQSVDKKISPLTGMIMQQAGTNPEEIEEIYRMTANAVVEDRYVISPYHREKSIESREDPYTHKGEAGLGFLSKPKRGE
ncbi:MAG TPA: nitrate reductase subunit beta [Bellilinea sp.]|nr:nitrate reductase subunit beta [Bellilinea sp.]